MNTRPDLRLHCRRCGGAFFEMVDLLFHPCGEPAKQTRQPRRKPKKRAGVSRG